MFSTIIQNGLFLLSFSLFLTSDAKISKALSEADNYRSQVKITDRQDRYDALVLEFKKYSAATGKENQEYASQANSKAVASGKANPYDSDVMYTATQGYAFMKTPIMAMGQTYTEVPVELCAIERLNQLIITNNKVALVPSEIGQLKNLKLLNLKKNKISELPEELGQLTKVEKMDFSNNRLSKLPDSIAKLTSLEKLNLKGNPFSGDEIARIKAALPNCKIKF